MFIYDYNDKSLGNDLRQSLLGSIIVILYILCIYNCIHIYIYINCELFSRFHLIVFKFKCIK